ncbi:hypothetical protein [Methylocystis sp. S23]
MLSWTSWLLRILVACRVSVISAATGFLLFDFVLPARDLFADISFGALPYSFEAWLRWLAFFFSVFFFWAFPVHYAARRMLDEKDWVAPARLKEINEAYVEEIDTVGAQRHALLTKLVPRLLGMTPFVAIAFGLLRAYRVVSEVDGLETAAEASLQIFILTGLDLIAGILFYRFIRARKNILDAVVSRVEDRRGKQFSREFVNRFFLFLANFCLLITGALYLAAYSQPALLAQIAPRAMVVPFLFGSLVLVAGWLARMAEKTGVPFLGLAIAAALGVTALNKHYNDMRVLPADPGKLDARQIDIDLAIDRWMAANHCDGDKCPPALIVSAEGGASRAAFALATAVGYLLDRADELPDAKEPGASPARRIFAISGVSGGSFGAATVRTALWEAARQGLASPPCKEPPKNWFHADKAEVKTSWRACLEALVVGDYLTPAFIGLGFRDNVAPPLPFIKDDRAVLVEKAWETHFAQVLDLDPSDDEAGLRRRFGYVGDMLTEGHWLPLLLLNGTSVNTGTRIVASDVISTRKSDGPEPGRAPLYPAAFDLFEMLSSPCGGAGDVICRAAESGSSDVPGIRNGADVRLSTAAMDSARFPIVSPAGIIRAAPGKDNPPEEDLGDRVVDGGYFENAGLTTSMDIARALYARGITPVVLWVQNDPTRGKCDAVDKNGSDGLPPRAAGTPHLKVADPQGLETIFGTLATPFNALIATRAGHADEAAETAQRVLEDMSESLNKEVDGIRSSYFTYKLYRAPNFDRGQCEKDEAPAIEDEELARACAPLKGLKPKMAEVSMSWWLSQPVQASVDSQICDWRNRKDLGNLRRRLSQMLSTKAAGAAR